MSYYKKVSLDQIDFRNRKYNFRTNFDKNDLTNSIKNEGLLHPILLHEDGRGGYIVIAGYRRALAYRDMKSVQIDAHIFSKDELPEDKLLRMAIAENVKRENLEPIE